MPFFLVGNFRKANLELAAYILVLWVVIFGLVMIYLNKLKLVSYKVFIFCLISVLLAAFIIPTPSGFVK